MEQVALGEIGLELSYFYKLTPRQYHNIECGYVRKQNNRSKEFWMMTRKIMFASLLPNSKNLKESQVLPFPWDKDETAVFDENFELELLEEVEKSKLFWQTQDVLKTAD